VLAVELGPLGLQVDQRVPCTLPARLQIGASHAHRVDDADRAGSAATG
jgi:hypothetical protein